MLYNGPSTHVCGGHSQNVGAKLNYHFILSPIIYHKCSHLTLGLYPKHKWTKTSSMPPFLTSRLAIPLSFYNEALQGFFFSLYLNKPPHDRESSFVNWGRSLLLIACRPSMTWILQPFMFYTGEGDLHP
jgi:hypothetical protein